MIDRHCEECSEGIEWCTLCNKEEARHFVDIGKGVTVYLCDKHVGPYSLATAVKYNPELLEQLNDEAPIVIGADDLPDELGAYAATNDCICDTWR